MKSVALKPLVFNGNVIEGYFIEFVGSLVSVWSNKVAGGRRGSIFGGIKQLSIPSSGKANYPKLKFRENGEYIHADAHRVIAENLIPFPKPKEISKKDWDATPESVKRHMQSLYFVNHIDHNKYNCHPSNLEWVTAKRNVHAYQEYKLGK